MRVPRIDTVVAEAGDLAGRGNHPVEDVLALGVSALRKHDGVVLFGQLLCCAENIVIINCVAARQGGEFGQVGCDDGRNFHQRAKRRNGCLAR